MAVTVHFAKTHLSKLLAEVEQGGEVVIARGTTPIAKLVSLEPTPAAARPPRVPGRLKGKVELTDAFFEPLPDDELALWNGEGD